MEALINMICELKMTAGCKKMCKNFMVIRRSIKELLAKSMVTRPMKCIVVNQSFLITQLMSMLKFWNQLKEETRKHKKLYLHLQQELEHTPQLREMTNNLIKNKNISVQTQTYRIK